MFFREAIADTRSSCTMIKQTNSDNKFVCDGQNSREGRSYLTVIILAFYDCFFQGSRIPSSRLQIMYTQDATLEITDLVACVSLQRQVLENKHKANVRKL
jgi:hypothetical protein